jgi:hypothetical protein
MAKNFQHIANLEYYEEKAQIDCLRAENENQTGLQPNLPIISLPLTGMDEVPNQDQTPSDKTLSEQSDENPNQTLAPSMALPNQTLAPSIAPPNQTLAHSMALPNQTSAHSIGKQDAGNGKEEAPVEAQSVLNKQDVLDIAQNNQVKKKRPLSLTNARVAGWEDGHDDLEEVLNGHTSLGGQTFRIHRDLIVLIMSAAAEMPNRAALQAKQEVFDQVTILAQIEMGKQIAEYEEQRRKMAAEHERHLDELKKEHQRMIEEAARVRKEYASAFMEAKTPTMDEIESAQSRRKGKRSRFNHTYHICNSRPYE